MLIDAQASYVVEMQALYLIGWRAAYVADLQLLCLLSWQAKYVFKLLFVAWALTYLVGVLRLTQALR